jgi:preprotein translocase subunit SecE
MAKKTRALTKRDQNAGQRFLRETVGELRKVSWPTRSEAIGLTKIVIIVMIIMAAILGGLDALFFDFFTAVLGS